MNSIFRRNNSESGDANKPTKPVTLYVIRLSPGCRVTWWYLIQTKIPYTLVDVDVITLDDKEEGTTEKKKLPEGCPPEGVPALVDGDILVFGVHSVLRYLSSRYCSYYAFGKTLPTRMRVESLIEWTENELHRVLGYRCVYPQISQKYRLPSNLASDQLVETGFKELAFLLEYLENKLLATGTSTSSVYLCDKELTVVDFFVATILMQAEWISFDLRLWPKLKSWLGSMKSQNGWDQVHKVHREFVQELKVLNEASL
ncbi:Glutathione S-transferase theta-1 [Holothuria leucospilota]|uniref:Glutathione S-transferase theta-1 n=1 Tax=Holothuria leucospilota TaxID=206669 RepID=A0A9Q1HDN1_HOLLE|nr:Glutathione S-transferase theta-1 [Holothuria leucospilota]